MANVNANSEMAGAIATPSQALEFMMAGNAYVTLKSLKTGERYTYRINKAKETREGMPITYFVALLAGSDNTQDYVYLGIVRNGTFALTSRSRMRNDSTPVKAIDWALRTLPHSAMMPANFEIWHNGRCGRCGRMLTVPESIAQGLGPECASKGGL